MQGNIRVVCICPHHLLPVEGMVHYGYVTEPGRPVIGLSKLVRIAKLVGRRAVIQEQLAQDLVDVLSEGEIGVEREDPQNGDTKPSRHKYQIGETVSKNVGVVINAAHGCMTCRGVMSQSRTHTSLFTGLLGKQRWQLDFYRGIDETGRLTP
jgi:GTP cyclohydrolase I